MKLSARSSLFSPPILKLSSRRRNSSSTSTAIQVIPAANAVANPVFNFLPEAQNPNNLVRLVCASLKRKDTSIWNSFREQGLFDKFSSHDLTRILLRSQSDSSASLAFFNWAKRHLGADPDVQNCCIMIHILVWSKKFKQGMEIMLELVQLNEEIDVSKKMNLFDTLLLCTNKCNWEPAAFDMLIKAYFRTGRVIESFKAFRRVTKAGFVPNLTTVNCLLNGLAKMGNYAKCWWVYEEMSRIRLHPNSITCNILASVLCKEGDVDKVNSFLEKMEEEEGFDPDIVTYNILIRQYCKAGRLKDAIHMYNIMCIRVMVPDLVTYTTLIHCLCDGGSIIEARRLFALMVHRGLKPDVIAYNTLIHGYCKEGMMQEARSLLFDMIGSRVHPDEFTCQMLIKGYHDTDRMISALNLVVDLARTGVRISEDTYCYLIIALCRDDRPFAAKSLFEQMPRYGHTPCGKMYSEMIESMCRGKFVKEALDFKNEMVAKGMKAETNAYRAIISCLSALDRSEEAILLMQEMVESGLPLDLDVCRALLNGLCKTRNWVEAETLLFFYAQKAHIFDSECYNGVSRVVLQECDFSEFIKFQVRMSKLGFVPNGLTCKYAIEGMQKAMADTTRCKILAI